MASLPQSWLDSWGTALSQGGQMIGQAALHPIGSAEQLFSGQGSASQLWNLATGTGLSDFVDNVLAAYFTTNPVPTATQIAKLRIQMDAQLKKARATSAQISQANAQLDAYVKNNGGGTFQVFSPGGLFSGQPNPEPNAGHKPKYGWLLLAGLAGLGVIVYAVS